MVFDCSNCTSNIYDAPNRNGDSGTVKKYRPKLEPYSWEPLLEFRKEYVRDREEFMGLQKEAAANKDFASAKFFSQCASEQLKLYRACCLLIGWYGGYHGLGDCPEINPWNWPDSLFPELLIVENRCSLLGYCDV